MTTVSILVLTAGFGEGHNAAARAVHAEFLARGINSRLEDPYPAAYGKPTEWARRGYIGLINRAPKIWSALYRWIDEHGHSRATGPGTGPLKRVLHNLVQETRPDCILSTFPAYNYLLERFPRPTPRITIITDSVSVNSIWVRCRPHLFITPNQATADSVRRLGVEDRWILPLGFPVSPVFAARNRPVREDPDATRGIRPRVLYIINSGRRNAEATAKRLLQRSDWQVTLAVGRDAELLQRLKRMAPPGTEIHGWTDQIPQLLMQHHVVLSKAGGATTQESIAALTPMVVNQIVPGQEEGNYELLRSVQSGGFADTPESIVAVLDNAFADSAKLWRRWRDNLRPISHPDAASRVADKALELASAGAAVLDSPDRVTRGLL